MHVEVGARSTVPGLSARFTRFTPMGVGVAVVGVVVVVIVVVVGASSHRS